MDKKKTLRTLYGFFSFIFLFSLFLPNTVFAITRIPNYLDQLTKGERLATALREGKYQRAKEMAEARLEDDPDNYRLLLILGYAEAGLENWDAALGSIRKAIRHAPKDQKEELLVDLGNIYFQQKNYAEAKKTYEKVLAKRPESVRALFRFGFLCQRAGEMPKARNYYARVLRLDPHHRNSIEALIQIHMQTGGYQEVIPLARKLQSVAPDRALGYYLEAVALARQPDPDYEAAIGLLRKARGMEPKSRQVLYTLGYVYLKKGQDDEAMSVLEESTRLAPGFFEAYKLLAILALKQNDLPTAVKHLEKALSLRSSPELYHLLGKGYLQLGRKEAGVDALAKSLEGASLGEAQFLAAEGLYEYVGGDFEESERKLRTALQKTPGIFETRVLLIVSLLNQRKYQDAIDEAQLGLRLHQESGKLILNLLAQAYLGKAMLVEAEKALIRALKEDPDFNTTHLNLSAVYFHQGKYDKTEEELTQILRRDPEHLQAKILLARVYQATSDYEKAEQYLRSLLVSAESHPALLREMILLQVRMNRFEEALQVAEELIARHPHSIGGYMLKSRVYASMGNQQLALATIDEGLGRAEEISSVLASGARLAAAIGQHERSLQYLERHRSEYGLHRMDLKRLYVMELIETGSTKAARTYINGSLPKQDARTSYLIGLSWLKDNDLPQAEAYLEKATKRDDRLDKAFFELARVKLSLEKQNEAIALLEKAIEINPEAEKYYHALALNHEFALQLDAAISVYEQGLSRKPDEIPFLRNTARLYLKKGDPQQAITYATRALGLASSEPSVPEMEIARAARLLGLAWAKEDDLHRAEGYLEEATRVGSRFHIAFFELARVKLMLGKRSEAISLLRKAIELNPQAEEYYLALGLVHERSGKLDLAISAYEQGISEKPEAMTLLNNLAMLHLRSEDTQKALSYATRALELAPSDPNILDTVGWVYFHMNQFDKAIPLLQKATANRPDFALFRYHLGLCYYEAGNLKEAKRELQIAVSKDENAVWGSEVKKLLSNISSH